MKKIGLLGGMSWESTSEYYRLINLLIRERLGKLHSVECILYSVDFEPIEQLQHEQKWDTLSEILITHAHSIENAGAELLLLCTNTMHKLADNIQAQITIPLIHIADSTAKRIREQTISKVALFGTQFTMEQEFYKSRLEQEYGIHVIVPVKSEREIIHSIIYDELCRGNITDRSERSLREIINNMVHNGAEGIVLGCTELPLLLHQENYNIPLFNTLKIHAEDAVEFSLQEN